jgi:predicted enzyme related to lactoylglutathione lyase
MSNTNVKVHTVIIQTSQMQTMADFYRKGFGWDEPAATGGDHLGFQLLEIYFGFDLIESAPPSTGVVSLWFEVENLDQSFEKFKMLGAKVKYPPTAKPWGATLAALYDPDGNLFGLTQRV